MDIYESRRYRCVAVLTLSSVCPTQLHADTTAAAVSLAADIGSVCAGVKASTCNRYYISQVAPHLSIGEQHLPPRGTHPEEQSIETILLGGSIR